MSVVRFLYDVLFNETSTTYSEWLDDRAATRRWEDEMEENRQDRLALDRQRNALKAERKAILREADSAEEYHLLMSERLEIEALRQEVANSPQRLSRIRKYEATCESLRKQIRDKKVGIGQSLDLGELQEQLEDAEAAVKAERGKSSKLSIQATPAVSPHLSDKQMAEMAQKSFARLVAAPQDQRSMLLAFWTNSIRNQYGGLVAEELAAKVRAMLETLP